LKVIGRTSSEMVRSADAVTAADKLDVSNIVMGSVRRSPAMIRVAAQLVSGRDGVEQWSEVFDRAPGDILLMQTEIAKSIADALRLQLGGESSLVAGGTTRADARDLYLQAIAVREAGLNEANVREAVRLFDASIKADPQFADAYAQKAESLTVLAGAFANTAADFDHGYAMAAQNARRAIALAPNRALGHSALAAALAGMLDVSGALAEHNRAYQLFAGEPEVLANYSFFMSKIGRPSEGIRAAERAISIDPLNARPYAMRSNAYWFARRYSDAEASFRETLEKSRARGPLAYTGLGNSLMLQGRNDAAREAYSLATSDNVYRLTGQAILYARTGNPAAAQQTLQRLIEKYGDSAAYQQAQVHAQLKHSDQAFAALERSWQVHDPGLLSMPADPFLDPVRNDPRFAAILKKMNFPG